MLKIRLKRIGRIKQPIYKIVLMKSLSKRDGKSIKEFGYYNPCTKVIHVNRALIQTYLNYGAYPTNTVRHLLKDIVKKNIQ